MLSPAVAALLAAVLAENAARELARTTAPAVAHPEINASRSDAARCATWLCRGAGCALRWTRPSRSHDGRSCDVCRRSKAASDAIRDRADVLTPVESRFRPRVPLSA